MSPYPLSYIKLFMSTSDLDSSFRSRSPHTPLSRPTTALSFTSVTTMSNNTEDSSQPRRSARAKIPNQDYDPTKVPSLANQIAKPTASSLAKTTKVAKSNKPSSVPSNLLPRSVSHTGPEQVFPECRNAWEICPKSKLL